ncbi:MAG: hypothetical protein ACXQTI_07360 [Candidatus Nezhaarchaeales archaeon]
MLQNLLHQITPLTLVVMGTLVLSFGIILVAAVMYKRPAEPTGEYSIALILAAILTIITGIFMIMLSVVLTLTP